MIADITSKLYPVFSLEKGELHAFLNPYTYLQLREHTGLLDDFDQVHFDGIVLCKLFKWVGLKTMPRRSFDMTSLAKEVFEEARETGLTVAVVGSENLVIDQAVDRLVSHFGISVVESRHGFFEDEDELSDYQKKLLEINPDILVVGMGAIRQEQFLSKFKEMGWQGTGFTCGGFLHQTAEAITYYPEFFNRTNLRWLYRMIKEPHTMRRYIIDYPKFLFHFCQDYRLWKKAEG